jgi:hypothetical protein
VSFCGCGEDPRLRGGFAAAGRIKIKTEITIRKTIKSRIKTKTRIDSGPGFFS